MSKGLESLKTLYHLAQANYVGDLECYKDIVETELKEKVKLEEMFNNDEELIEKLDKENRLQEQILTIIKTKRVNIRCLMANWSLGKYNSYKAHKNLTKGEYELLKGYFNHE